MLEKESRWIRDVVKELQLGKDAICLNFGSQINSYNVKNKFIYSNVIMPIEEKCMIKNLDIKKGSGIDISGDILDDGFFQKILNYKFDCILICNVLEHVKNYVELCKRISLLVKENGYIIFSGPFDFPKHLDPIDNSFRPTVEDVKKLFPKFYLIKGEIINDYSLSYYFFRDFKYASRTVLRTLLPIYKFNKWKNIVIPKYRYWNRNYKVTCVFLKKGRL